MHLTILTNSSLSTFRRCPRAYRHRYIDGYVPERSAQYFTFGSAWHVAMQARVGGKSQDDAIAAALETIHDELSRHTLAVLIAAYYWLYQDDVIEAEDIIECETPFTVPIVNPDTDRRCRWATYSGKRDLVYRRRADGRLVMREYKTTGTSIAPDSDYWMRLRADYQISFYLNAARDAGLAIDEIEYDVVRKPEIEPRQIPIVDENGVKIVIDANGERVRTKDGKKWRESGDASQGFELQTRTETPEEFAERLMADIQTRPEFYYARREIARTNDELLEARRAMWSQQELLRETARNNWYFRSVGPFTCDRCEYREPCLSNVPISSARGFVKIDDVHQELS